MELPKITVLPKTMAELMNLMKSGALQVPRFQREFVWPLAKTRALLDSIYKEFPIGTFFLWKAPANTPLLSRPLTELGIPEPLPGSSVQYILDGQQRLTSLFAVIEGIKIDSTNYGQICIDLEIATEYFSHKEGGFDKDIFVYRQPDNKRYIQVPELVGVNSLTIFDGIAQEWKPAFNKAFNLLRTYPFSVVEIQEQTLEDAIIIFQRINQGGKRLTRYDLVCANVWTKDFDFRRQVADVNKTFKQGFGEIDGTILTQAFALILKGQCTTAIELDLKIGEIRSAWDRVIRSIRLAIDFAVNNLGVIRSDYLPYRGVLVVLAYYFYYAPNSALSARERHGLWNWFWRVTLSERYSSTSPMKMAEDAQQLRLFMNGQDIRFDYRLTVTPNAIARTTLTSTTSALRNAVLCMLALQHPKSLKDGSPINLKDDFFSDLKKTERHHVFPIAYLKGRRIESKLVHMLPNFVFLPSDLNKEISDLPPADYMARYKLENPHFAAAAESHLLPTEQGSAIWNNEFEKFMEERATLIATALERLIEISPVEPVALVIAPFASEVDALEVRIRDFIDHRLIALVGSHYWRQTMPGDVIVRAKELIKGRQERQPYIEEPQTDRERLDFCDVGDYEKILLKNWDQFEEYFIRKEELQRHLAAYSALRNCAQHNRKPTDVELKNGQAAMLWANRIITKYYDDVAAEQVVEEDGDSVENAE